MQVNIKFQKDHQPTQRKECTVSFEKRLIHVEGAKEDVFQFEFMLELNDDQHDVAAKLEIDRPVMIDGRKVAHFKATLSHDPLLSLLG